MCRAVLEKSGPLSVCGAMAAQELGAVLSGQGYPLPAGGGCDWGPPEPPEPARLRRNTCYIVLAVLLNEKSEVLMVQEAKRECYGAWYLPAGRMEPGETIVEAMRREVAEETGLQCQPRTLLAVEERGPGWIRFVFLAEPTGGALKTLQDADAESLQARWWDRERPSLSLRAADILPLMELALQYRASPRHPPGLPAELPCAFLCQRLLLACIGAQGSLWVLLGTAGGPHLPLVVSSMAPPVLHRPLLLAVLELARKCLPPAQAAISIRGLLGLQHLGREPGQSDGVCLNVVATVGEPLEPPWEAPPTLQDTAFTWWKVEDGALRSKALCRLSASAFIPIQS